MSLFSIIQFDRSSKIYFFLLLINKLILFKWNACLPSLFLLFYFILWFISWGRKIKTKHTTKQYIYVCMYTLVVVNLIFIQTGPFKSFVGTTFLEVMSDGWNQAGRYGLPYVPPQNAICPTYSLPVCCISVLPRDRDVANLMLVPI